MNQWNNYETLEHHEGMIWVSKLFKSENRGNICVLENGTFRVLSYVSPNELNNKGLSTIVKEWVKANGTLYMLEEKITCTICGKNYNEADVNIVDYPDDVCINCEKNYHESIAMNEYDEIKKEQELIEQAEKETFQELNGFSDEENDFIRWKYHQEV